MYQSSGHYGRAVFTAQLLQLYREHSHVSEQWSSPLHGLCLLQNSPTLKIEGTSGTMGRRSFLIIVVGRRIFGRGLFTYFRGGAEILRSMLWGRKLFCLKIFWMKSSIKD